MLRAAIVRATNWLRGRRRDEEMDQEIADHLALLTQEYIERGFSPAEARNAALRSFGSVERIRSMNRAQAGFPALDEFVQDARFALRLLLRNPRFALGAILVLGLGIGINNMYFTLIYGHTMRGLPINEPDRVLHVSRVGQREVNQALSFAEFESLRHARTIDLAGAHFAVPMTLTDDDRAPDRYLGAYISAESFGVVGIAPSVGRGVLPADDRDGAPGVVLINKRVWETRYGRDPAVLGRSVRVDGVAATVVGIVPDRSGFPSVAEVWRPLGQMTGLRDSNTRTLQVLGRIRDEVEPEAAAAELEAIVTRAAENSAPQQEGVRGRVTPISAQYFGRPTDPAWIAFIAAATLVLIVSCANAANLMIARASARTRELAIRGALGASRFRVIRQLLVESTVLAVISGGVGFGVSVIGARLAQNLIPENAMPYWFHYRMDPTILTVLIGVSLGTVFVFGLIPAVHVSKTDIHEILKARGRTGLAARSSPWTTAFLTMQFGLTVILVAYAVIDLRTRDARLRSDDTVQAPDLLSATVTLPRDAYPRPTDRLTFYRMAYQRFAATPGVASISIASTLPRRGAVERRLDVEGGLSDIEARAWTVSVGPTFFSTLGLQGVIGREFADADGTAGRKNAVVNQRFVELFSSGQSPVGRRVRLGHTEAASVEGDWFTVVGVMPDIRHRANVDPMVYLPLNETAPVTVSILVRTSGDQRTVVDRLREEMRRIDSNLPLYRVMTMAEVIDEVAWVGELSSRLARTLTIVALLLAVAGLYAVTANTVGLRSREIGLRMALGARTSQVRRLIVKRAAMQVSLGLVVGILCTMAWDAAFFSDRIARDPDVLRFASLPIVGPTAALLLLVTLIACVVPVRRATRLDPVAVLREE
jgi:predicted permease